jgi:hypothetical protein
MDVLNQKSGGSRPPLIQFEKRLNNNQDFQSSFSLHNYLMQYMLKGPAAAFTRDQILTVLEKTNNDPHAACSLLFSMNRK